MFPAVHPEELFPKLGSSIEMGATEASPTPSGGTGSAHGLQRFFSSMESRAWDPPGSVILVVLLEKWGLEWGETEFISRLIF